MRCTLMQWFKEVGFSTLYGALLLKTWRISVVFRVRSAARVRITDMDLIKRLGLIIAVSLFYLIVRTVVSAPTVEIGESLHGLKAYQCSYDWWDYAANIAELVLLLWGIRLCYVVRKAPSEFNESRFISWAIYNETLLSLFLCVATFFLQDLANPDVLYLIWFFYSQLTTTVVIVLLFGSKCYLVLHGKGDKTDSRMKTGTTGLRQRTWDATNSLSSQGLMVKHEEKPLNQVDIQEELKRLYTQLELLKTRNMVVGNPHLTRKLTAMAEAARATEQMLIDSNEHELSCASNGVAEVTYTVNNGRTNSASTKGDWI
ncbi:probable G-protein coupled receptor CG31760 [Lytechinus variegatus]|uniref:probable G-protein coupled receptor CG31760 n=1 Tax=Lytechinus variegatus TaxID=7654 RepID=UPI001BB2833D|nr:probable G-protein coupled receptor CG31760 [Lytechinus variegatus]